MRTKKSFINMITSIIFIIITGILGFVKIRFFIGSLGSEANGLIQMIYRILSYLSLAEMGFGSALIYKLYKPLSENDREKISQLMTTATKFFNKVGTGILCFLIIFMFVIPFMIKGNSFNNIELYVIFLLAGIPYVIENTWYRKYSIIINADQKQYKTSLVNNICTIIYDLLVAFLLTKGITIIEYILISYPFVFVRGIILNFIYKKNYSYIHKTKTMDKEAFSLSKDVFVHNIGSMVNNSADQIILSVFNGLAFVSIYSSYYYIVKYLGSIANAVLYSVVHSFGNLFANDTEKNTKNYSVFKEYLSFASFISIIICVMFYFGILSFIDLWIGDPKYILSIAGVLSFVYLIYTNIIFIPISVAISSNGLFKGTKYYSFIATIVNVVLSLALIQKFQIAGIVFATVISKLIVLTPLDIKALYKGVFTEHSKKDYYLQIIKSLGIITAIIIIINILDLRKFYTSGTFNWICVSGISGILLLVIILIVYYLTDKYFVLFLKRCKKLIVKEKKA